MVHIFLDSSLSFIFHSSSAGPAIPPPEHIRVLSAASPAPSPPLLPATLDPSPAVLSRADSAPGHIWQYATGIWWVGARDAADVIPCPGQSSQQGTIWSLMSLVPRWRNPDLQPKPPWSLAWILLYIFLLEGGCFLSCPLLPQSIFCSARQVFLECKSNRVFSCFKAPTPLAVSFLTAPCSAPRHLALLGSLVPAVPFFLGSSNSPGTPASWPLLCGSSNQMLRPLASQGQLLPALQVSTQMSPLQRPPPPRQCFLDCAHHCAACLVCVCVFSAVSLSHWTLSCSLNICHENE